VKERKGLLHKP